MKRTTAIILCLALCLSLCFSLASCGQNQPAQAPDTAQDSGDRSGDDSGSGSQPAMRNGGAVQSPQNVTYGVYNRLVFEHYGDDSERPGCAYIYGLKDMDVEDKINQAIIDTYDELRASDVPPYRGIRSYLGPEPEPEEMEWYNCGTYSMECNSYANFNNILSVGVFKSSTYKAPDGDDNLTYVSDMRTLNFDLNTGEQIALEDLFCDDVDGLAILSDYIGELILDHNLQE